MRSEVAKNRVVTQSISPHLLGRTKVDLDFFYLVSLDGKEFVVPTTASVFGFAVVEDEGFVPCLKQLLDTIGNQVSR